MGGDAAEPARRGRRAGGRGDLARSSGAYAGRWVAGEAPARAPSGRRAA